MLPGRAVAALALIVLGLCAPVDGAILGDRRFTSEVDYDQDLGAGSSLTILSGAMAAQLAPSPAAYGFHNSTGTQVTGVAKACWAATRGGCAEGDNLTVRVAAGGSFGYRTPLSSGASVRAEHAMAVFVDLASLPEFGQLPLTRSVVASTVGSRFTPGTWLPAPATQVPTIDTAVALLPLDPATSVTVWDGTALLHTATGVDEPVLLQGQARMAPFGAQLMLLPFTPGARLDMGRATQAAAEAGVDLDRLGADLARVTGGSSDEVDLGAMAPIVARVLDGALVQAPTGAGTSAEDVQFVRFSQATATGGLSVVVTGKGPLVVQDNHVAGAPGLIGIWVVQFPWWTYALWGLGLTMYILAEVKKSPKRNEHWDRYNWIGIEATVVASLLCLWLWDLEFRNLFGASLLQGGLGDSFAVVAAAEIGMAMLVHFAVVSPLRMSIAHGLRFMGHGQFMRLPRPIAMMLGLVLGVGLMRAYLDYGLQYAFG